MRNNQLNAVSSLIATIKDATVKYKFMQSKDARKNKGQFFTSDCIAKFMARNTAVPSRDEIRILDPGAGNGILSISLLAELLKKPSIKSIHISFVENDPDILDVLDIVKNELHRICDIGPVDITCEILTGNFITMEISDKYDTVISNPPYLKIPKNSPEALHMSEYVYGQPNLYALFVIKAFNLLKDDGVYTFITPRSWTSGNYFLKMRNCIVDNSTVSRIHLFDVRDNVFSSEKVLQETMIWCGRKKKSMKKSEVHISTSSSGNFDNYSEFSVPLADIILNNNSKILLLPQCIEDHVLIKHINSEEETFGSLGYIFKTGPVVEFRNKELLSNNRKAPSIPMFRSANIGDRGFVFPANTDKAQYIATDKHSPLALLNSPTLMIKRLSAKEESRRLQCCAYTPIANEEYISIENHVNYMARKDGKPLSVEEVEWAYNIISSREYDRYYRIISGSTQVNAQDLNSLPVRRPS
jgi:adenine-specific DNA-methyltransferase